MSGVKQPGWRVAARVVGGACAVGLSLATSLAWATPVDAFGIGARSKAMGQAMTAEARDFSASYYNPARLVRVDTLEVSFGYTAAHARLHSVAADSVASHSPTSATPPDGADTRANLQPLRGWEGGLVVPGNVLGLPIAVGVAFHLPDGHLSTSETVRPGDRYWVLYESRLQLMYSSLTIALAPTDWLALGVGVATLATTDGGFDVRGTAVLPAGTRTEHASDLRHQIDADLLTVHRAHLGLDVKLDEAFDLGATYRERAKVEVELAAELDGVIDAGAVQIPVVYELQSRTVPADVPRQASVGASYRFAPAWTLVGDVTWVDWSAYEGPISSTVTRVSAEPPPGIGLELPPATDTGPSDDPGFSDRWVPRVGLERRLTLHPDVELALRAGYAFEATPVPERQRRTTFLDGDRHTGTFGMGLRLGGAGVREWRLATFGQVAHVAERTVSREEPAATYRVGGSVLAAGVTLTAALH